jgi:hypothetical protein
MSQNNFESNEPRKADEIAARLGLPRAFLTLAMECGAPFIDGKIGEHSLLEWLTNNCDRIIEVAGLFGVQPAVKVADADDQNYANFIRLSEVVRNYCGSRFTDPERKKAIQSLPPWDAVEALAEMEKLRSEILAAIRPPEKENR